MTEKVFDVVYREAVLIDVFVAPVEQRFVAGKFLAELRVSACNTAEQSEPETKKPALLTTG